MRQSLMTFRVSLLALATCCLVAVGATTAASPQDPPSAQQPAAPEPLPPGPGFDILVNACTSCHDLDEVTKLKGQLDRDEWRGLVKRMADYGAQMTAKETDVLVEYLDQHFGKK